MSITAKLYVEDKVYNIISLQIKIKKEVNRIGLPNTDFMGGYFDIEIETTKDNTITNWMLAHSGLKDARIEIPSRFGTSNTRIIDLKDVFCIEHEDFFNSTSAESMSTKFRLSPGGVYNNGKEGFIKHWHEPKPEIKPEEKKEKDEKKVTLFFEASNSDIKNGKFGYDKLLENYKKIYKSDIASLENEYKPLQVYGEKYFPVWVSMRKGQTITLKIDATKRKNFKLFENIKFSPNPDFTFEPANLKDASEVHITCNNTNETPTQINVEGDGEVVGAVNFFYPEPKEVKLRWVTVDFNKGDKAKIVSNYNSEKLKNYLKTALNPALIDIKILNQNTEILDMISPVTNPLEQAFIERIKTNFEVGKNDSVKQDQQSRINLIASLNTLHLRRNNREESDEIYLYLTNLKSSLTTESPYNSDDTTVLSNNGATVGNACLMFLANEGQLMNPSVEIPHEVMHALGLDHTFLKGEKHIYEQKSTKNYMDYDNTKESTFFWQWQLLH